MSAKYNTYILEFIYSNAIPHNKEMDKNDNEKGKCTQFLMTVFAEDAQEYL